MNLLRDADSLFSLFLLQWLINSQRVCMCWPMNRL